MDLFCTFYLFACFLPANTPQLKLHSKTLSKFQTAAISFFFFYNIKMFPSFPPNGNQLKLNFSMQCCSLGSDILLYNESPAWKHLYLIPLKN